MHICMTYIIKFVFFQNIVICHAVWMYMHFDGLLAVNVVFVTELL